MQPVRVSFGTGQLMFAGGVHDPRVVGAAHPPSGRSPAASRVWSDEASTPASALDSAATSIAAAATSETDASLPPAPLPPAVASVPPEPESLLPQPASTAAPTSTARRLVRA